MLLESPAPMQSPQPIAAQLVFEEDSATRFFNEKFSGTFSCFFLLRSALRHNVPLHSAENDHILRNKLGGVPGFSLHDINNDVLRNVRFLLRRKELLDSLMNTRTGTTPVEAETSLQQLNPANLNLEELFFLSDFVRWEAEKFLEKAQLPEHLGCFGTGGDQTHTLNISTISSVIAAHYLLHKQINDVCVIKLGTAAITGNWGSADVAAGITKHLPQEGNSRYYKLSELGFPYSPSLREARRRYSLTSPEEVDPYKVLFPGSNLTRASHTVTGYARDRQFDLLKLLAERHNINSVFIHSNATGSDELTAGTNKITTREKSGSWVTRIQEIKVENREECDKFLVERDNKEEQISAAVQILRNDCPPDVTKVISYNVAVIIRSQFPEHTLSDLAEEIEQFMQSQSKNPTIVKAGLGR